MGNYHGSFLGEGSAAMPCPYPTSLPSCRFHRPNARFPPEPDPQHSSSQAIFQKSTRQTPVLATQPIRQDFRVLDHLFGVYRGQTDQLSSIIAAINNQKADLQVDTNCSDIGEPGTNDSAAAFAHFWSTEDAQFKRGARE